MKQMKQLLCLLFGQAAAQFRELDALRKASHRISHCHQSSRTFLGRAERFLLFNFTM